MRLSQSLYTELQLLCDFKFHPMYAWMWFSTLCASCRQREHEYVCILQYYHQVAPCCEHYTMFVSCNRCAPMHTYIHAPIIPCTHASMHPYSHAHIYPCTHTPMHTYIHAPILPCTHTSMHPYSHAAHIHLCAHTSMHTSDVDDCNATFYCSWESDTLIWWLKVIPLLTVFATIGRWSI